MKMIEELETMYGMVLNLDKLTDDELNKIYEVVVNSKSSRLINADLDNDTSVIITLWPELSSLVNKFKLEEDYVDNLLGEHDLTREDLKTFIGWGLTVSVDSLNLDDVKEINKLLKNSNIFDLINNKFTYENIIYVAFPGIDRFENIIKVPLKSIDMALKKMGLTIPILLDYHKRQSTNK